MLWFLWVACSNGADTGEAVVDDCSRDCLDSPYHQCGAYVEAAESMSCQALAVGVAVDDWTAYRLTQDGLPVASARVGSTLTADCDGSVLLEVWSVLDDEAGCSMVEAIPQSCAALAGGLAWDGADISGWVVEAITADGDVALTSAYTTQTRLYAECPKGVEQARVVGVLPDLADLGLGGEYWK